MILPSKGVTSPLRPEAGIDKAGLRPDHDEDDDDGGGGVDDGDDDDDGDGDNDHDVLNAIKAAPPSCETCKSSTNRYKMPTITQTMKLSRKIQTIANYIFALFSGTKFYKFYKLRPPCKCCSL